MQLHYIHSTIIDKDFHYAIIYLYLHTIRGNAYVN